MLGLREKAKTDIDEKVNAMSTTDIRKELRKNPSMRTGGTRAEIGSRLRNLWKGENFPVEEDDGDEEAQSDDYETEQQEKKQKLEEEKRIINQQLQSVNKALKLCEKQVEWSVDDATEFYGEYIEEVAPVAALNYQPKDFIIFEYKGILTSGTIVTAVEQHFFVSLAELHGKVVNQPGTDSLITIPSETVVYIVEAETKKNLVKKLKKVKITPAASSVASSTAQSTMTTPRSSVVPCIEIEGGIPEELVAKIAKIKVTTYTKSSVALGECKNLYFGLGMAGFPNQQPKGTTSVPEIEQEIVNYVKSKTELPFTAVLLNRYSKGDYMGEHNDTNTPGHPQQFLSVFGQYEGGQLHIAEKILGNGEYIIDARLKHSVSEVTKGTRFSIVAFHKGMTGDVNTETIERLTNVGYPYSVEKID